MKQAFLSFEQKLTTFSLILACLLLCVASSLGLYQVLSRFLFNHPSTWSEIAIRLTLIWMVMFAVVTGFREGSHVCVDLMFRLSKGGWNRALHLLLTVIILLYLSVLIIYGFDMAWRVRFQEIGGLEILPMSVGYLALPVGAIFGIFSTIANFISPRRNDLETQQ